MSEPYYSRGGVTLYLGDCRDVLPTLGKDSAGMLLTDPPYGVGFRSNRGQNFDAIVGDDDASFVAGALEIACRRTVRNHRHAYVFGPDSLLPVQLTGRTELVWDKAAVNMGDLTQPWGTGHERITFATVSRSAANRKAGDGRLAARLRQGSVIRVQRPNSRGASRHPTEKPVALLRRLVESSSVMGDVVLDPFIGSGSTAIAAVVEGRGCVGIEVDETYAETAAKRCDVVLDWLSAAPPL